MTNSLVEDMVRELKPCPFCGKQPLIVCPDNSYGSAMITCGDDNECPVDLTAWGDLQTGETLDDAVKAWNTRAVLKDRLSEDDWELVERLRKQSQCIYIAVEATVADDISDALQTAAERIIVLGGGKGII